MSLFSSRLILNQGASRGVIKRLCIVISHHRLLMYCWATRSTSSSRVTGTDCWCYMILSRHRGSNSSYPFIYIYIYRILDI